MSCCDLDLWPLNLERLYLHTVSRGQTLGIGLPNLSELNSRLNYGIYDFASSCCRFFVGFMFFKKISTQHWVIPAMSSPNWFGSIHPPLS